MAAEMPFDAAQDRLRRRDRHGEDFYREDREEREDGRGEEILATIRLRSSQADSNQMHTDKFSGWMGFFGGLAFHIFICTADSGRWRLR
jgi:hypothetical protein